MHDEPCIGECTHHASGAAGMVEMHMRRNHVIDVLDRDILPFKRFQNRRQGSVASGLDQCRLPVFDKQENRREPGADITCVDQRNVRYVFSHSEFSFLCV